MKHMLLLINIVILFACGQKSERVKKDITEIKLISDEFNQIEISRLLKDITLIPLETKDESLIGNVRRIKADEDCFYIMDYNDTPVKIFSKKGTFVSQAGYKGNGPGEYIQMDDILVNGDTVCICTWSGKRKWIRYSKDNQFLYETDMAFPFEEICRIGNDKYLVYVGNGTVSDESACYLYCLDKDFKLLSRLDPKVPPTDISLSIEQTYFSQMGDRTLYMKEYCDTIYTVSGNLEIYPEYHLDFGRHWYPKAFLERFHDQNFMTIHEAIDKNNYVRWIKFRENDRHLIVSYYISNGKKTYDTFFAVHCKDTGKTFNFKSSSGDLYVNLMIHPYCIQENQFIGLINADELLDLASEITGNDAVSEKIKKCAEQISETDNPVLVRFDFKSFKDI